MDMIRFKSLTWTEKLSMVTMFYPGTFFGGGGFVVKPGSTILVDCLHIQHRRTLLKYRFIPTSAGKDTF